MVARVVARHRHRFCQSAASQVKTLLLAPELFVADGGIARALRVYLKALCELAEPDGRVDVLALNDATLSSADLRRYSGPRLGHWRACQGKKRAFIWHALRLACDADRLVCGHVAQLPVAWLAKKRHPQLAYYLVAHGIEVWRRPTLWERQALRGARRIWCVSTYTESEVRRHTSLAPGQTQVLPNGLDPFFSPGPVAPPPSAEPIVLVVSRLSRADAYKGIDRLIEAWPAVRREFPAASLRRSGR
jgi:glycosyltransferase involved in cell wall biosynthesis